MNDSKKTLGQLLRECRESVGMSRRRLAEFLGVGYGRVYVIENDLANISLNGLMKWRKCLPFNEDIYKKFVESKFASLGVDVSATIKVLDSSEEIEDI